MLIKEGYEDLTFFPNTRYFKDVWVEGLPFDAICKFNDEVCLIQAKTNLKPTKKTIQKYKDFYDKFGVRALWINKPDGEGVEVFP